MVLRWGSIGWSFPGFSHILFWFSSLASHLAVMSLSASMMVLVSQAEVTVLIFPAGIPKSVIILFSKSFVCKGVR